MIELSQTGRVFRITLNRPEKRNALTLELCRSLAEAFERADHDASVNAVLLTGKGPAFCAGMDLKDSLDANPAYLADVHEKLFTVIQRIRKPIIAAVRGAALAGGTGLAANAHILVAHPEARFGLTEIRIGLWPVMIFRAVAHAIGERRAVELCVTGRNLTAAEAHAWGLVSEIADDPEARAEEIAETVGAFSQHALVAGLDFVNLTRGRSWEESGRIGGKVRQRLLAGDDYKEAVRAFLAGIR